MTDEITIPQWVLADADLAANEARDLCIAEKLEALAKSKRQFAAEIQAIREALDRFRNHDLHRATILPLSKEPSHD